MTCAAWLFLGSYSLYASFFSWDAGAQAAPAVCIGFAPFGTRVFCGGGLFDRLRYEILHNTLTRKRYDNTNTSVLEARLQLTPSPP